jgi:hypothetical protein
MTLLYTINMVNRKNNIITNKETCDSVLYLINMANRKNNIITNKETCDSEDDHGTKIDTKESFTQGWNISCSYG